MLDTVGAPSMDAFIAEVIPADVVAPLAEPLGIAWSDEKIERVMESWSQRNASRLWLNGGGYYPVVTPPVIKRNILENPAWYTSYTPYQAEVSQGRLESLLNFQTMVSDLTGLPVANSSLLDEGTAAAEAMTLSFNSLSTSRARRPNKTYVVSDLLNRRTVKVMQGRAEGFGLQLRTLNLASQEGLDEMAALGEDLVGVMVQYPDFLGGVQDFSALAELVHKQNALLSVATDLLALTILKPPGEWGADVAFGNSQRFGVPLGYGGPHAAFMAVKESSKRRLPGRIVGVSQDRLGNPALRLALQTREQHIRREKATSNVCTAQALLANMAAMFAVYHGPDQLREMAVWGLRNSRMLQAAAQHFGYLVQSKSVHSSGLALSDTLTIQPTGPLSAIDLRKILRRDHFIDCSLSNDSLVMALPTDFHPHSFASIVKVLHEGASKNQTDKPDDLAKDLWNTVRKESSKAILRDIPDVVRRQSSFLAHPVFNSHHSETEMLRYMHHLQSRDISLVHSMIPLGSCTMKLNGTKQMELIGKHGFSGTHPYAALDIMNGWRKLFQSLTFKFANLTGMDAVSLQPNSGAQGEFAGLRAIRMFHQSRGQEARDICLIPVSAHGTNPASAAMAGMRVVPVKCDTATGNLDLVDLEDKCKKHAKELAAIMITYPSTYGVFEPQIRKVCVLVHKYGGQVYMDGANMNAQIGITSPGAIGADVCHLNLHKTFCIPHGGGGPGVGPICMKNHLSQFCPGLKPDDPGAHPVSSAEYGSASILPISWAYIFAMGDSGLRKATETALLNANYLLSRLKEHYPILYTNDAGRCAHEFILDIRPFQKTAGIEALDVAKRLQDYGFHAPTMSFPVANTLMVEPTESESKQELDRFADALIAIRQEIREIEEGSQPHEGNVLKMAPHPQVDLILGDGEGKWERPYSREKAAYPLPYLKTKKFWPVVARVDDSKCHLYSACCAE